MIEQAYDKDRGVVFRVREKDGDFIIDISDNDFDRWANSTRCTISIEQFFKDHMLYRQTNKEGNNL